MKASPLFLCCVLALFTAAPACGGGGGRSGGGDQDIDAAVGGHKDAAPGSPVDGALGSADAGGSGSLGAGVTIQYSDMECGDIDGYRSRFLGGAWNPGRTFAVGLPAQTADIAVSAIEYSFQYNVGGSADVDLAHRMWLYIGDSATPPTSGPLASWDVPAGSGDVDNRLVHVDVVGTQPVIPAGKIPFIVIDLTPTGATFGSLDVDQCYTQTDPQGSYLFFAAQTDPPYTWLVQAPDFTNYVPDMRIIGAIKL